MTNNLTKMVANFESSIVNTLEPSGTSFELFSNLDEDGNVLEDGKYSFTLSEGQDVEEHTIGNLEGRIFTITLRNVQRNDGLTPQTGERHRKGSSVKITNFVPLKRVVDIISGTTPLDHENPLEYAETPTYTGGKKQLVDFDTVSSKIVAETTELVAGLTVGNSAIIDFTSRSSYLDIPEDSMVKYGTDGNLIPASSTDDDIDETTILGYTKVAIPRDTLASEGIVKSGLTKRTHNFYLSGQKAYLGVNGEVTSVGNIYIGIFKNGGEFIMDGEVIKKNILEAQKGNQGDVSENNTYQTEDSDVLVKLVDNQSKVVPITGQLKIDYKTSIEGGELKVIKNGVSQTISNGEDGDLFLEDITSLTIEQTSDNSVYTKVKQSNQGVPYIAVYSNNTGDLTSISPDGRYLYVLEGDSQILQRNGVLKKYEFATQNDFSSALTLVDGNIYTFTEAYEHNIYGMDCKNNGTDNVIFITHGFSSLSDNRISKIIDLAGGANIQNIDCNSITGAYSRYNINGIAISDDGLHLIGIGREPFTNNNQKFLVHHTMSTAFDLSTLSTVTTTNSSSFSYALVTTGFKITVQFLSGTICKILSNSRIYTTPSNYRVDQSTSIVVSGYDSNTGSDTVEGAGSVENIRKFYATESDGTLDITSVFKISTEAIGETFLRVSKLKLI